MANRLFNEMQNASNNGMMQQFQTFMQNPFQYMLQKRINIPQQYMNDPKGAIQYLMQNGQMTNEQFNYLKQMANQMGVNLK